MRGPVTRQLTQLLDQARVQRERGVDPAERVDGLGLDPGPRVEDAVDRVPEILLGRREDREAGQQQHRHLRLEDGLQQENGSIRIQEALQNTYGGIYVIDNPRPKCNFLFPNLDLALRTLNKVCQ